MESVLSLLEHSFLKKVTFPIGYYPDDAVQRYQVWLEGAMPITSWWGPEVQAGVAIFLAKLTSLDRSPQSDLLKAWTLQTSPNPCHIDRALFSNPATMLRRFSSYGNRSNPFTDVQDQDQVVHFAGS